MNKIKREIKRYEASLDRYWYEFDNDPRPILDYNNFPKGFKLYPNELLFGATSLLVKSQEEYIKYLESRIGQLHTDSLLLDVETLVKNVQVLYGEISDGND